MYQSASVLVPGTGDFGGAGCGSIDCAGVAEGCFTGTPVDVDRIAYHSASDETDAVFFDTAGALVISRPANGMYACGGVNEGGRMGMGVSGEPEMD